MVDELNLLLYSRNHPFRNVSFLTPGRCTPRTFPALQRTQHRTDLLTFNVTEAYYFEATIYCKIERQEHVNCMKSGILLGLSWCPVLQLRWKQTTNFE